MSNTRPLVAYYSRRGQNYVSGGIVDLAVGNTEVAAAIIVARTGGVPYQIETVDPYPDDYSETTEVAREELREQARPALSRLLNDIDDHDVIFLGYPNWWGTPPMAVFTFLESFDFTRKTIIPFCTHEGSGMGHSERDIRNTCPGADVLPGLAITGSAVQGASPAINRWIESTGLDFDNPTA